MTSDQFAYWLQGFTELNGEPPNETQWQQIKDHLALVFNKVTPERRPAPVRLPDSDDVMRRLNIFDKWKPPMETTCSTISADTTTRMFC